MILVHLWPSRKFGTIAVFPHPHPRPPVTDWWDLSEVTWMVAVINNRIFFKFFSSYFIQIDSGRYLGCDWGGDTAIVPIITFFNKEKFRSRPWQKIFSLIGVGIGRLILWYWHKYSRRISMKKQGPAVQIGAACEKFVKSALQILDAWA